MERLRLRDGRRRTPPGFYDVLRRSFTATPYAYVQTRLADPRVPQFALHSERSVAQSIG